MKKALIQCTLRLKIIFMHICLVANRLYMKNSIIPEMFAACIINVLSYQTSLHTVMV